MARYSKVTYMGSRGEREEMIETGRGEGEERIETSRGEGEERLETIGTAGGSRPFRSKTIAAHV
jgi:hypothetical protein